MKHLTYSESDHIAILTFSRPDALNVLNGEVFVELNDLLDKIEKSATIQLVILTGHGKAFIAGADIVEMKGKSAIEARMFSQIGQETLSRIEQLPIPFIGVINGYALGGGLEMALACDFLIASDQARFGAPEVNLGLIPGFGGTQRLARVIGLNYARYYLYTAQMFDAIEALRMGLVQLVFDEDHLMDQALEIARLIISKSPTACQTLGAVISEGLRSGFAAGCKKENEVFAQLISTEGQEGMLAFLEKRKPNWT